MLGASASASASVGASAGVGASVSPNAHVDFVVDNYGYELFTDLVRRAFLISSTQILPHY